MLSVDQCKAIIKTNLPDDEIKVVRDALYPLVESVLDRLFAIQSEYGASHTGALNKSASRDTN